MIDRFQDNRKADMWFGVAVAFMVNASDGRLRGTVEILRDEGFCWRSIAESLFRLHLDAA